MYILTFKGLQTDIIEGIVKTINIKTQQKQHFKRFIKVLKYFNEMDYV